MRMGQWLGRYHTDCIIRLFDLTANLDQLCTDGLQMLRNDILDCHITLCGCCCKHECTGLNLIRNHGIFCLVKLFHTADTDDIRSCALNIGSHAV